MELTDRKFWLNYWENKKGLIFEVPNDYILSAILKNIAEKEKPKNAIELGGFPGYYAIYLKKYLNINSSLLDYVIHPKLINDLISKNQLKNGDIQLIETDIFRDSSRETYDLVMSVGLIEHFEDTKKIIQVHLNYLKENGTLFINIPNFQGLNGIVQKRFDPENYSKHFIPCMDIEYLKQKCEELNLKKIKVGYYGGFMMWLENIETKSQLFKVLFKATWFIVKVISKIIPIETKFFSPYINIIAKK